ncbi:glycosyl transferase family 1 [Kitasatospora sp. MMS16-BH015]|uniref:glycogen synthase n=1 Tax=Kitasatospora sp. MMS16-BH015 TaxID=2018025 RepID=UPI000CA38827|nr:glycogen synthase [Kitasatospora sp. MMS16-BH015]AUG78042.1 glycosyl transferase family 1 [Kitasatospora sp. MMS16-BH015]
MRVELLTRDYPSQTRGEAGGHTVELTRALRRRIRVRVRCFHTERAEPDTYAYRGPEGHEQGYSAFQFLGAGLGMADDCFDADLVHSHTWATNAAGHVAGRLYGIPHVMTMQDKELLGAGHESEAAEERPDGRHALSGWMERASAHEADALIAESDATRETILALYPEVARERTHVIRPGVDTELWWPDHGAAVLDRFGIDPAKPIVMFAGPVTRRKGLPHLLRAAFLFRPDAQLVLCCEQPKSPEVAREVDELIDELSRRRAGVFRINSTLDQLGMRQLLAHATLFACPSVREATGAVNLKAMACGTPVVATAVGSIPEFVEHGDTGLLVRYEQHEDGSGEPVDRERFAFDLAHSVNVLLDDPELAARLGEAGRRRAVQDFSWDGAAERTLAVYQHLTADR